MKPIFRGTVEQGRVKLNDPDRYKVYLAQLEGKEVELTVKKHNPHRSNSANSYLFGVVYAVLSDYTGYDTEQMHDAMKEKFASRRTEGGLLITERTSRMDSARFTQYIDDVKRFAADELGLYIPEAGEVEV